MAPLRTRWSLPAAALVSLSAAVTAGAVIGDVIYFTGYAAVCAAAWWAALRRVGPGERWPWLLVAVAQTFWLAGDLVSTIAFRFFPDADPTGWMDAPWLAGYLAIGTGIMTMARLRARGQLREPLLDMLTLTTAAAIGMWWLLVAPALEKSGGLYSVGIALDAGYMLGDVLITAAVLLLVLSPGTRGAPTRMLVTAVCLRLVTDLGYAVLPHLGVVSLVSLGGLVLFGNALMVITALHPGRAELIRPNPRTRTLHPARIVFLGLALLTAPTVAVAQGSGPQAQRVALLIATVAASAFILARFAGAVREQERAERLLAYQASYDPLTGLANRRTITARLDACSAGDVLLYLDLDGFKAVNDTYGHDAGDALLVEVARRLRAAVREDDLVVRLGGDEFALLCPQASVHADVIPLAERVLEAIAAPIGYDGHELRVGTSIGIAVVDATTTPGDLVRKADAAMYEAKRAGRGRWVLAGPPPQPAPLSLAG
ncbi:GGDEF domain-containing protein [Planomonospora sp. ID82291]|uniref:GGDEF domain-containing protein n=1 Tax=Planomonospora sp. ID82291 TaxID=2738136 RepID=UPI0018C406B3|nr:GGDEF domain-containing protein [Planomonospora sp. ID82291]MBG0818550.1 GGDEF domain-containing protein [Planomonospora sp. ID82291]